MQSSTTSRNSMSNNEPENNRRRPSLKSHLSFHISAQQSMQQHPHALMTKDTTPQTPKAGKKREENLCEHERTRSGTSPFDTNGFAIRSLNAVLVSHSP